MANKGITKLRKIQFGFCGAGTPETMANATEIWRGEGRLKKKIEREQAPENVGKLLNNPAKTTLFTESELELPEAHATYEQLPALLAMILEDVRTGVADGEGSGKIYQFDIANTDEPDIAYSCWECGNNQREEEFAYGYLEELTLKGDAAGVVKVTGKVRGNGAAEGTFTAGLSLRTIEAIRFAAAKLYIDDSGDSLGSTLLSHTILGFELTFKSPLVPEYDGEADKNYEDVACGEWEVSLKITFKHNANADLELDAWETDNNVRLVKLLIEGSDLATEGTDYAAKSFILNMAGVWGDFETDSSNGTEICTGTLELVDSETDSLNLQMIVVNEVASY